MNIKKWLFAGKHNHYHPTLLRPIGLGLVVAALVGVNLAYNLTAAHSFKVLGIATDINSSDVISLTNQQRANSGLGALRYNSQLTTAAQNKAADMFAKDYWAHNSPTGETPWDFMIAAGYKYSTAGENLAKDFDTSAGVVTAWMNSPEHRANILNSSFVDTGVAVVNGTLQGEQTTLVVAMYASPAPTPAPAPAPSSSTPSSSSASSSGSAAKPATTPASTSAATQPTTTPTETPQPTTVTSKPKTVSQSSASVPVKDAAKTIAARDVAVRASRTWAQNASLFLLSMVFLVLVLKHTVVWRTQRRGWRHIWLRAHPAAQYVLLLIAIGANVVGGAGVIR